MIHKLYRNRNIAYVLILSFVFALFSPMSARAGVLGSLLSFVKPYAKILGNIGGAVAGASLGSAFCPPLGTIAGGIIGYVVGGVVGNYAAGGLSNVATLAGAAVGYAALASSGPVGMVAGVFLGGLLGKVAYSLVKKLDNSITGGVVFAPEAVKEADSSTSVTVGEDNVVLSDSIPVSNTEANKTIAQQPSVTGADMSIQEATQKYQEAYQKYVTAARDGANSEEITKAHKEYLEAYENYKNVTSAK
ncbi:MAG: hypothetical protein J6Z11_17105 [Candidatus Riflebacteria bacterium]|nr:hypothetical protein [Candidatus Riflebacteria bacterium]